MIDAPTLADLDGVLKTGHSTRAMGILAALAASFVPLGDERLIVAMMFSNRHRREFASVAGYFADRLPLAIELTGNPTFRELTRRVEATWHDALSHLLALDLIADAVGYDRLRDPLPLYDVGFNYLQTAPVADAPPPRGGRGAPADDDRADRLGPGASRRAARPGRLDDGLELHRLGVARRPPRDRSGHAGHATPHGAGSRLRRALRGAAVPARRPAGRAD